MFVAKRVTAFDYSDRERAALAWAEAVTLIVQHHLPDEVYAEAAGVFSEQELVDLNLAAMSINSWNRLSIAFRYEPDRDREYRGIAPQSHRGHGDRRKGSV